MTKTMKTFIVFVTVTVRLSALQEGDVGTALLRLQAGSALLNTISEDDDDANGESISTAATSVRSSLLDSMVSVVDYLQLNTSGPSVDIIESTAVCVDTLATHNPTSLSKQDQLNVLDVLDASADISADLKSISNLAASSLTNGISSIAIAGLLKEFNNFNRSSTVKRASDLTKTVNART